MKKYYQVLGRVNESGVIAHYCLGYTSNKWKFQRNSGWKMDDLVFVRLYASSRKSAGDN